MESSDPFVTIATFTYPPELAIIRGRLESEGIECFARDELTIQVNNFYSNALGGVKLQVRQSDAERALQIMNEDAIDEETLEELSSNAKSSESDLSCPACGSSEISKGKLSPKAFAISCLLLGFPLPFFSRDYHCFNCGNDFKSKPN